MLWITWFRVVLQLRSAFKRERTFFWFITVLIGFSIRKDISGITSFVRSVQIDPKYYSNLCRLFSSKAIDLNKLTVLWTKKCFEFFSNYLIRVNGKTIFICDGIKVGKEGKKMPGVKSLHQESQSNSKKEYIMGHSWQAISLLVGISGAFFAVPIVARIHEGFVTSNRSKKTLHDKLIDLLKNLELTNSFYIVADAYYAVGKIIKGGMKNGGDLISRIRNTSVAYYQYAASTNSNKSIGRPRKYGEKIKLKKIFENTNNFEEFASPVYGEVNVKIKIFSLDLIWRPIGALVRFVWVIHPNRGKMILISSDITIAPIEIVSLYGLRIKIEVSFKEALRRLGSYCYHFWMNTKKKTKRYSGDEYLHHESSEYREKFFEKINSYHIHVQIGIIAQGLLQYLSIVKHELVWKSFGSWIRTIRPNVLPTESVVAVALSNGYMNFLIDGINNVSFKKFLRKRILFSGFPSKDLKKVS